MLLITPDMRDEADLLLKRALDATDVATPFTPSLLDEFCYAVCAKLAYFGTVNGASALELRETYERIAKITCRPVIEVVRLSGGADLRAWNPPTFVFSTSFKKLLPGA